ncbi:MAG: hypothetical protein PHF63_04655 [Herbinix sp.]|nr:hypothetical protein [Herbinix sp.]
MNSCELVSLITAVSCGIAKCVPEDEIPQVAAIFGQISATLATITVHEAANKPKEIIPEVTPDTEILTVQPNILF